MTSKERVRQFFAIYDIKDFAPSALELMAKMIDDAVMEERAECGRLALLIETEGQPDLRGDPDVPTPITNAILARYINSN